MPFARNVELVAYLDLGGRPGFKLAMQEVGGRFYLYVPGLWESGVSIVDVTDPSSPQLLRWVPGPPNTWMIQVQVADGRMVTNLEPIPTGWGVDPNGPAPEVGFLVWDVSDPVDPRRLGRWDSGATGTHRNFYAGGRYVHAATALPGFVGKLYAIVDIDDAEHPKTVGRWWYPGQHAAGGEVFTELDQYRRTTGRPGQTEPISHHGGAYVVGDRAYCPWGRGGMVTLDISDVTAPQVVSILSVYPPLGTSIAVHTVVPFPERGIALINDEAIADRRNEPVNFAAVVDMRDEREPQLRSLFPTPEPPDGLGEAFFDRGGRFGPHNQHQPQAHPSLGPSDDFVYLTWFNAGLQVFDISEPRRPRIAGYYIPDDPTTRLGPKPADLVTQVEDVLVDRRGFAYLTEKNSGLHVVRFRPGTS